MEIWPKRTRVWGYSREVFEQHQSEGMIWWGKEGKAGVPAFKRYRDSLRGGGGTVPPTFWSHEFADHTDGAKKELRDVFGTQASLDFFTPKPTRVIERVLQIATHPGDLVLDSFAGSGTTGHAVLKMNAAAPEGEARRFILVEVDEKIAPDITRERVKRVAEGYTNAKGENVPVLGGGFRYVRLGDELFDEHGRINETKVRFPDLARHVYFSETGEPLPKERISAKTPLLGVHHGRAVYLLYNGILKDKSVDGGNVLTSTTLDHLPAHDGPKVVYAAGCRFSKARLEREGITFKQTPYAIRTR
jgi:site-specific DNA-methyltransferase (adenine-specific)/adenine-specific DNA-methyltransferase